MKNQSKDAGTRENVCALEFERPLVKIEKQIAEMEAGQAVTGRDVSATIQTVRAELLTARREL